MKKDIMFNLKKEYFDQIKIGEKKFEYRLITNYWKKRLENRDYDNLIFKLGYPSNKETRKIILMKYNGYEIQKIKHKHFGDSEVSVFAIKITGEIND